MTSVRSTATAFSFADCVLDPGRRELTRDAVAVAIGPQVFDLLLYLVENRDRVVTKDDVLDAVWRGRIVSESTLTSHINAARKAIGDDGQAQRLIRTIARKGFRFVGEVTEAPVAATVDDAPSESAEDDAPALPNKPSIAVLPFVNLSDDREQDYFADGVVEDIISALSRMRWLFVVARNSSFAYKGRAVDVRQIGRELGVRYVLEGSVRKAKERVRITGQLIDAGTQGHLWADRFEGRLDDIFELQDSITESVIGAIAPELERAEIERARNKPTENLDAYDHYLRGMASFHVGTQDAIAEALPCFHQAHTLDPSFAAAYGMAAWCVVWRKVNGWLVDPALELADGASWAGTALKLGKDDAVALTRGGHALAHLSGDVASSIPLLDRALTLNPNLGAAWFLSGFLMMWNGESEAAIPRFEHAMRLSPLDPELYRMQAGLAMAHLLGARFETAVVWAEKSAREQPVFTMALAVIAAGRALAGRLAEARVAMDRLRELDPALCLAAVPTWLPFQRPEDAALFVAGLREAGLPES
jgi:TolB-like protein